MKPNRLDKLADLPPEQYHATAYCECGDSVNVNDRLLPDGIRIKTLMDRLRCSVCGRHGPLVIIAWHGAIRNPMEHHGARPNR